MDVIIMVVAGLLPAWFYIEKAWSATKSRQRGGLAWRRNFLIFAVATTVVALAASTASVLSVWLAVTAQLPWDSWSYIDQPWMPNLLPLGGALALVAAFYSASFMWRSWPTLRTGRVQRGVTALALLALCAVTTTALFGEANAAYDGSYPQPPQIYAHAGEGVSHMSLDVGVGEGEDFAFLSGGVTVTVTLQTEPFAHAAFMLLGDGYFAQSSFTASDPTVHRAGRGSFAEGYRDGGACVERKGATRAEWFSSIDTYLPLRGDLVADASGLASVTVKFNESHDWYTALGGRTAVRLPRIHIASMSSSECTVGYGGYAGSWAAPDHVAGSMRVAPTNKASRDIEFVDAFGLNSERASLQELSGDDLVWGSQDEGQTAALLAAGYIAESPSSLARAQALLFASALVGGLALAALLQLLWSWPAGVSTLNWADGVWPSRGRPRLKGRVKIRLASSAVRRPAPKSRMRRWRRKGYF